MAPSRQFDKSSSDPISIAVEHVTYLRRLGLGIRQSMAAINLQAAQDDGWDAVVWAYASTFERERLA
jgi:hypothetical protein